LRLQPYKKENGGSKIKKIQPSAKKNNSTSDFVTASDLLYKPTPVQASCNEKKNQDRQKSTSGSCHLCGAKGMIVKKISGYCKMGYPYFSFRIERDQGDHNFNKKNRMEERSISKNFRKFWQKE